MYDEFQKRGVRVIAISQEDKDLESHARFLDHFDGKPKFDVVADIGREQTKLYDRTTTYLIDKTGKVRQVFPMTIHHRANWSAVLAELDALPTD